MPTPILDIFLPETHSAKLLAIGDLSDYSGITPVTPTIEITPPGWNKVTLPFVAKSVQVYDSGTLGITPPGCTTVNLPDGMYTIKYSIAPAYQYFIEKTIFLLHSLQEKLDECWVKASLNCDIKRTDITLLDGIESYLQAAIAAANRCATKIAQGHYEMANKLLDNYLNK